MSIIKQVLKRIFYSTTMPTNGYKMVLVVRTDIPMGIGKIAAQCAHAALECYRRASTKKALREIFDAWLHLGQPKIVLRISGEDNLLKLAEKANQAGLVTAIIRDAGRTQLTPGTITALGIGPAAADDINPFTSHLKLL